LKNFEFRSKPSCGSAGPLRLRGSFLSTRTAQLAPEFACAIHCLEIVEADETFFSASAKGSRKLVGRAPRIRGGKLNIPGLPEEQVPVLIVRHRLGATLDSKPPNLAGNTMKSFRRSMVARDAVFVSDGAKVYGSFAKEIGIEH
jgi:hypothetical protein